MSRHHSCSASRISARPQSAGLRDPESSQMVWRGRCSRWGSLIDQVFQLLAGDVQDMKSLTNLHSMGLTHARMLFHGQEVAGHYCWIWSQPMATFCAFSGWVSQRSTPTSSEKQAAPSAAGPLNLQDDQSMVSQWPQESSQQANEEGLLMYLPSAWCAHP